MRFSPQSAIISMASKLPRKIKTALGVFYDFIGLCIAFYISVALLGETSNSQETILLCLVFVLCSLAVLGMLGVYKAVIEFFGIRLLELIIFAQLFSSSIFALSISYFFEEVNIGLTVLVFLLSIFILGGSRLLVREIIYLSKRPDHRLLIYGAGKAGIQLLTAIRQDDRYQVVGFLDDRKYVQKRQLHGVEVFPASQLSDLVLKKRISMVALALPSADREKLQSILDSLEPLPVVVKTLPRISELLDGGSSFGDLEEVRLEQLLGRARVSPDENLIKQNIQHKMVVVTGAGGSIGSELCRQIVLRSPKKLILVELSELALYDIHQELGAAWDHLLVPILGSVGDDVLMKQLMIDHDVDTVYHAAAYKHVPLVEANPFAAMSNNFFGTKTLLEASIEAGVSSFTLVSTDKAVRPTNVMGASKRLAEILCQMSSAQNGVKTKISMVRFGNVVGSSGSVIPKFREQIKNGGPVTVTHPEITRYFMVIPEAVELVLQSSSLASGGEVFVLDMGAPIKIVDLVSRLIRFSGYEPGNSEFSSPGTIGIKYTGLRPGEKLYEELLISGDIQSTVHAKIFKINELFPKEHTMDAFIRDLIGLCDERNGIALRELLMDQNIGYEAEDMGLGVSGKTDNFETFRESKISDNLIDLNSEDTATIDVTDTLDIHANVFKLGKFWRRLLHTYFLLSRALTLGVRVMIRNERNEILLVRHTYSPGWYLPGGGVEPGEDALAAVERELSEEVGVEFVPNLKFLDLIYNKGVSRRDHVMVYETTLTSDKVSGEVSFEIAEIVFFAVEKLPNDVEPISSHVIKSYH